MKVKIKLITLLLICVLILGACANSNQTASTGSSSGPSDQGKQGKEITIGALWYSFTIPAVKIVIEGVDEEAKKLGVKVIHVDTKGDAQVMYNEAMNLLTKGVDGLIINPIDPKGATSILKKYKEKGIPVVAEALNVSEDAQQYLTSFVGPDDVEVGRVAAGIVKEALGDKGGNVVVIEGTPGSSPALDRTKGFEEGLKGSNVNILDKQASRVWTRAEALSIMQNLISKYGDKIDAVFAHNDDSALGAVKAIDQAGKTGKIKVIGYGAYAEACEAIKKGEMYGTATQPLKWEGAKDVQVIVDYLNNKPVEKWYPDKIEIITKENVDSYKPLF
jgi:ABC-type sugar transport system substrate-binding protein